MKKKLLSLMSLLTVGIMAWAFVPAALFAPDGTDGGTPDPSLIMGVQPGTERRMTVTKTGDNEFLFETTGADSYLSLTPLPSDLASDMTAVTFEYKLNKQTDCEFFFSPIVGGNEQAFLLDAAEDWTVSYVDISSWRQKLGWGKKGDFLRMDVGNAPGIVMSIRNIQPATSEAYQAYLDEKSGLKPVDGWYMLGSAQDLAKFAKIVNNVNSTANAKLTADIDLSEIEDWTPIAATSACAYAGVFDGQGHTIKGFKKVAKTDGAGLFGYVIKGAVKNLTVYGELSCMGNYGGLIAWAQGATVENVHSYLNIKCQAANTHHVGGVVGNARDNSVVSNCSFHGTLEVGANNTDCFGGIAGYTNTAKFVNCANYGEITCDNPQCLCGGILGYLNNTANPGIQNCYGGGSVKCITGGEVYVGAIAGHLKSYNAATIFNNYWNENSAVQGSNVLMFAGIQKVSNDQVQSGAICYALNGDQSSLNWFQNLGEDNAPVLDNTHKPVYVDGHISCAGQPIGEVAYTNETGKTQQDGHRFEFGVCQDCGSTNLDFCKQDAEGYYQIGTAEELVWFANTVNSGVKGMKAKLVEDIDMSEMSDRFPMIGTRANKFIDGTFDGQFHRIINLNINRESEEFVGLFGCVGGKVDIRNIIIDHSCTFTGTAFMGIVGGSDSVDDIYLTNLGMEGTVQGSEQNISGIYGCNWGSTSNTYIDHCYVTGHISGGRESAAISGWMGGKGYVKNSWSIAKVDGHDANQPFGRNCNYANCWINIPGHTDAGINLIEGEDAAATGELCYLLNGKSIENPIWFQNLDEDIYPTWDNTHGVVYKFETYGDIHDEATLAEFTDKYSTYLSGVAMSTVATQSLLDELAEMAENMPKVSTLEEFVPTFKSAQAKLAEIEKSAAAYVAYKEKVDYIADYLENDDTFFGELRDQLEVYIKSDAEPNDEFINGGAVYILDNHLLTTEEIKAETEAAQEMLVNAIKNGYGIGSELTNMISNPKFLEGAASWNISTNASHQINGGEVMKAAEFFNGNFDIYQDIEGLRPGVYEVRVNGAFRSLPWQTSTNYAAQFYANDVTTYLKNYFDENVPVDEAVDGVNANLTIPNTDLVVETEEGSAYVPHGSQGAAIHFANGQYESRLTVVVTDGKLRIGAKNTGSGNANDWATISNFRLFYMGELKDASESMDATLAGMADRAKVIQEWVADGADFTYYPNFAQSLKDELAATVGKIGSADEPADKMELIKTFSKIFDEIPASKRAYRAYAAAIDAYYDGVDHLDIEESEIIPETEAFNDIWEKLLDGSYSTDEAEAQTDLKTRPYYGSIFGEKPEKDAEGFYLLATPANYVWYMKHVNAGSYQSKAKMVADLDMGGSFLQVICKSTPYNGHFDGQGHKFSNVKIEDTGNHTGMWGIAGNCTIENFVLDETCSIIGQNRTAIVGATNTTFVTCNINNVGNEGYVKGDANAGAIFGCNAGGETAFVRITNCYSTGTIDANLESGVLAGYLRYGGIYNSWSSATISPTAYNYPENKPFAHIFGEAKNNWICSEYELNPNFDIKKCTEEQVENGELCWLLNQNSGKSEPTWFQNIGVDAHPVLDPTHGEVVKNEDGTFSTYDGINGVMANTNTSNAIYDLQGRRVSKTTKGLYIVGNKKILVK